jgi:alpha-amylase
MKKSITTLFLTLLIMTAMASADESDNSYYFLEPLEVKLPDPGPVNRTPGWANESAFYQIYVWAWKDSNDDGIGDLQGVIDSLDYLQDLGVGAIWLMPVFRTSSLHGYDVVDYREINSRYGDMKTFEKLLEEAHRRDIKVILDLVLNHTSYRHKWFKETTAMNNKSDSYYVTWKEKLDWTTPWSDRISTWHFQKETYYYGIFSSSMPDLNYRNPTVVEEVADIIRFWLEKDVDGFRMDAIRYLVEDGKGKQADTENTHRVWQYLRSVLDEYDDRIFVGEAWTSPELVRQYYGDKENEFNFCFDFAGSQAMFKSVYTRQAKNLEDHIKTVLHDLPGDSRYALFLNNHDRVSNRLITNYQSNEQNAKLAMATLLTLEGVPFIYYGDEIGIHGRVKSDRNLRSPMQWSGASPSAGFSSIPSKQIKKVYADYPVQNAESMSQNPGSLHRWIREILKLRNSERALNSGRITLLAAKKSRSVLAFSKSDGVDTFYVLINYDKAADTIQFPATTTLYPAWGSSTPTKITGNNVSVTIEPKSMMIYSTKKINNPYIPERDRDSNTNHKEAVEIRGRIRETLSTSADSDWYFINSRNSKTLTIKLADLDDDVDLVVFDKRLEVVASSASNGITREKITLPEVTGKSRYYVKVISRLGKTSGYSLTYSRGM